MIRWLFGGQRRGGMVAMEEFEGGLNGVFAMAMSLDARYAVGQSDTVGATYAVRWDEYGKIEILGQLVEGASEEAVDVSGDGSVVVGKSRYKVGSDYEQRAFI